MKRCHPWDIRTGNSKEDAYWSVAGLDLAWVSLSTSANKMIEKTATARSRSRSNSNNNFAKDNELEGNIHGFAAEKAISFLTNQTINQHEVLVSSSTPDVGEYEVKATKYDRSWRLYVNESTMKPARKYILCMTYLYPKYIAAIGWAFGYQVNRGPEKLPWREREQAYWIPWGELTSIKDIISMDIGEAELGINAVQSDQP